MRAQLQMTSQSEQFTHGNDAYRFNGEVKADFSTNTWYLGADAELLSFLEKEIGCIANYPELQSESLTELLADYHHLAKDQILVCNGTAEAIFFIAQVFQNSNSRIITPTFSEYEHASQNYNHKISFCGAGFVSENMNTPEGLMWLCNPNNPTGQVFSKDLLQKIIGNNPQTIFIVDEAYADFCMEDISLVSSLGNYKNLLILKSMTKNYCLPGLRLGYVIGHQSIIKKLSACRPPWAVNSLALKAGEYSIRNILLSEERKMAYLALSREFRMELEAISSLEVFTSSTGFFLVKTPMLAAELKLLLVEEYGLLIRDASNFRTLSEYHIRLATLTREKNTMMLAALKTIFK